MTDLKPSLDDKLKEAQLRDVEHSIKIKQTELETKSSVWKSVLLQSGLIAGVLSIPVTLIGAYIASQTARHHQTLEAEFKRNQQQIENTKLLIEVLKTPNHDTSRANLRFLIGAGLVEDKSNRIKGYLDDLCKREGKTENSFGLASGGGFSDGAGGGGGGLSGVGIGGNPCVGVR